MMNIWKHGKYVDLWSVVHFLSGYLLGSLFYWLGADFGWALLFAGVLMVVWELFEAATKIIEPSPNVAVDIILGFGGFLFAARLFYWRELNFSLALFVTVLGLNALLALWGFVDFLKRGYH